MNSSIKLGVLVNLSTDGVSFRLTYSSSVSQKSESEDESLKKSDS